MRYLLLFMAFSVGAADFEENFRRSPQFQLFTNGLATIVFVRQATNGFVDIRITNGLASISYVQNATNGFVDNRITNGLSTTSYVNSATGALAGIFILNKNGIGTNTDFYDLNLVDGYKLKFNSGASYITYNGGIRFEDNSTFLAYISDSSFGSGGFFPGADDSYDLGAGDMGDARWRNLVLSGNITMSGATPHILLVDHTTHLQIGTENIDLYDNFNGWYAQVLRLDDSDVSIIGTNSVNFIIVNGSGGNGDVSVVGGVNGTVDLYGTPKGTLGITTPWISSWILTNIAAVSTVTAGGLHAATVGKGWTNDLGGRADLEMQVKFISASGGIPALAFTNTVTGQGWTNQFGLGIAATNIVKIDVLDLSPSDNGSWSDVSIGAGGSVSIMQAWWKVK